MKTNAIPNSAWRQSAVKGPVWNLVTAVAVSAAVLYVGFRFFPKLGERVVALSSIAAGVLAGWWGAPYVSGFFGYDSTFDNLKIMGPPSCSGP